MTLEWATIMTALDQYSCPCKTIFSEKRARLHHDLQQLPVQFLIFQIVLSHLWKPEEAGSSSRILCCAFIIGLFSNGYLHVGGLKCSTCALPSTLFTQRKPSRLS